MLNRFRILPALLVAAVAGSGRPASAVTLTVNTAVDADAGDGSCSLREAILAANTDTAYRECPAGAGADRIVFDLALPAAIDLSSDLLVDGFELARTLRWSSEAP
jgi:CSLREA domain-containing protein